MSAVPYDLEVNTGQYLTKYDSIVNPVRKALSAMGMAGKGTFFIDDEDLLREVI